MLAVCMLILPGVNVINEAADEESLQRHSEYQINRK